jgi:hypothetical protein
MNCASCKCKIDIQSGDRYGNSVILGCEALPLCQTCYLVEQEMVEKEGTNLQVEVAKRYYARPNPFVILPRG